MPGYVGLVYGDASPLYCRDEGDSYHVINGHYKLLKSEMASLLPNCRVVLVNMDYYSDYNKACETILEAANADGSR